MPRSNLPAQQKSAQDNIGCIKWRNLHEVLVYTHNLTGTLYGLPERGRHLQNLIGRTRFRNPCADLHMLFRSQQVQVQHLVNRLHLGLQVAFHIGPKARTPKGNKRICRHNGKDQGRKKLQVQNSCRFTTSRPKQVKQLLKPLWCLYSCMALPKQNWHQRRTCPSMESSSVLPMAAPITILVAATRLPCLLSQ